MSETARIGIVTVSDRASAGVYDDEGGPAIREYFNRVLVSPWQPVARVIPDDRIVSVSIHEAFSKNPRAHASVAIGTVVNTPVIAKLGFERALASALDLLSGKCDQVYVHVDTDVLDPTVLRANRHCADGGLTDAQVSRGLELIADRFDILAVSFSSFDPDEDERGPSVLVPLMTKAAIEAARSKQARN